MQICSHYYLQNIGYLGEQLDLYLVSKNIGTLWFGIGKVEEKLDVETAADANIDISFSAKYMLDALKTMKDEEILILLNGEVKPIVIKSMNDESLIQLILPIKTY